MTVHPSPVSRPRRLVLQLALAALGALPVQALAEGPPAPEVPPPPAIEAPPAPPRELPQPNLEVQTPQPPAAAPVDGQWVYTQQYGWVWMPYAPSYTYVPAQGNPVMFVYGPTFGWHWVAAPWVFDYGPVPYWGVHGRAYFAWYSHPWFVRRPYRSAYRAPRPSYHYHGAARHDGHVHEHDHHHH